tara:strand:- start:50 stop:595 length:546 start_codon:yes stop_codon:yes gene_type:complete
MMPINNLVKSVVIGLAFVSLASCKSSNDAEKEMTDAGSMGSTSSEWTSSAAQARGAGTSGRLSAEQIQAENALRQTVFYFDFDVAEFRGADRETLVYHARALSANPSKRLRLGGHADERGTREYNLALGERRANSILNYLIVNGASRSQIEVVSYGEERPAMTGQSESVYNRNRRVEVVAR